jgi:hypothetical protein
VTGAEPDTRPRARAKGEEVGATESMLDRGELCTAGGVFGAAGAKGSGGRSFGVLGG